MKLRRPTAVEIGRKWEDAAAKYLQSRGMVEIDRNFRGRRGEIDLVMLDGEVLVFVEVRYRGPGLVKAVESIDWRKIRRIVIQVNRYLCENNHSGPCRVDVVAIDGKSDGTWSMEHIVSAIEDPY